MGNPLISIVIVVYNGGSTLQKAIESVVSQTYQYIELIIIDGGSKDNTLEVINNFKNRIAYFTSEKDAGVYDAMNKGIAAAKGEWLFFLGADDRLYNDDVIADIFLNKDLTGTDFLYGDVELTSNKKRFGGEKDFKRLLEKNICHQAIFHRRNIFDKLGSFNKRYPVLADFEMNIRIFRDESIRKKYLSSIITFFNNRGMSCNTLDRHFHGDMLKILLEKDKIPFFDPHLQEFHFYYGLIGLYSKKTIRALKHIPLSWISGRRKLFYFLFTIKFMLRTLTGNHIKIKQG